MEHAVERLMAYLDIERTKLINEWSSGEYKKLSCCPSYEAVKAYCDAINILNKHWMCDYEPISPRSLVKERRREL